MRKKPGFQPNLAFPGMPGQLSECLAGAGGFEPRHSQFANGL